MTIDWDELLRVYREAIEDEAIVERVVRRWLTQHGMVSTPDGLADILAELERRLEANPEPVATLPPPEPAPLYPPPPPSTPQAEPAAPPSHELAPSARQEPAMPSADLGAALSRALPAALSLYQIAHDSGAIEEIADAVASTARRAARLAKRSPLTEAQREELQREACDEARCVIPGIPEQALETIGEIVIDAIDAIDEHTNTGPLEEVDGEVAKRGLAAPLDRIELWSLDSGNLEARVQRARRQAERAEAEVARLEKIAARRRARG